MAMGNIIGYQEYLIKDYLKMECGMEKVIGKRITEIVMKANLLTIKKVDSGILNGLVAISMLDNTLMIKDMVMEKCFGLMVTITKDSGKKENNTEKVY